MARLNRDAANNALEAGVRCATDITGFGLAGHLYNVARASGVRIALEGGRLPILPGVQRMALEGNTTAGAQKNRAFIADALSISASTPEWLRDVVVDPQTSGGLALFSKQRMADYPLIGRVEEGEPAIVLA